MGAWIKTPEQSWDSAFEVQNCLLPKICAYSQNMRPDPEDWPVTDKIQVIGNLKLSKEFQDEYTKKGSSFFTSGAKDFDECKEFIEKASPPVYIGWGSMYVYTSQHMAKLAVEALKAAGERGIILGGWARISLESLDGCENEEELKAYCKENVLFLKSAPHELLFPL